MKEDGKRVCGNHYFEGFCIDLAEKVTEILNITNYTVCLVQDGNYGAIQANQTWDGMIGELMQKVIIGTEATLYRLIVIQRSSHLIYNKDFLNIYNATNHLKKYHLLVNIYTRNFMRYLDD